MTGAKELLQLWHTNSQSCTCLSHLYIDMGKQVAVLAWALANLSKQQVEETLAGRDGVNPRWTGKADHETVRWYQAAQKIREDGNAQAIEDEVIVGALTDRIHVHRKNLWMLSVTIK